MEIRAHAKINLTLDVFSRRPDGFHGLASVMQTISLHDTLRLRTCEEPGIHFVCDAPDVPCDATNLVVRAAQAALDTRPERAVGLIIELEKRIPAQAGMGGGSSDAASTLLSVDRLLDLRLDPGELKSLAAGLGSDVPFFLSGGTATARGRGEAITPLPDLEPFWLVVVKPEQSVATGWAYQALDAIPDRRSHRGTRRMEEALQQGDRGRMIAFQCNDFELPVFEHFPEIAWLHDELRMAGALNAHLCGSGSACYGMTESQAEAERIAGLLRRRYARVSVARTLTRAEHSADHGVVSEAR